MLSADGKKTCTRCGQSKPAASEFARSGRGDGYAARCKRCRRQAYREWRAANPAEWKASLQRCQEARRRQRESDPQRVADIGRLSRARRVDRKGAPKVGLMTLWQWLEVRQAFGDRCCYCGAKEGLSLDHLTPISRGGRTTLGNVAVACRRCNSRKHKLSVEEFCPGQAGEIRRRAWLVEEREKVALRAPR